MGSNTNTHVPSAKHAAETVSEWACWSDVVAGRKTVSLTGNDLSIADVVAVSQQVQPLDPRTELN